ncbi:MAG TPA: hypothetical protein VHD62_08625 [Opitutaceae bacterium]|nr:hypothetical protein [Opitutaceae bacterium]
MSTVTEQTAAEAEPGGLEMVLPPRLLAAFERADKQLAEAYGSAPGVAVLVRLWLACATAAVVRKEFESAVLQVNDSVFAFDRADESDGDDA